jgi:hypothetical protein
MSVGPYMVPSARLTSALAGSGKDIPDFKGELDVINGPGLTFCCTTGPLPSPPYGAAAGRLDPPLALLSDCIASVVIRGPAPLPEAPSVVSGNDGLIPTLFPEQPVTISNVPITTMANKCFTVSPQIFKWPDVLTPSTINAFKYRKKSAPPLKLIYPRSLPATSLTSSGTSVEAGPIRTSSKKCALAGSSSPM